MHKWVCLKCGCVVLNCKTCFCGNTIEKNTELYKERIEKVKEYIDTHEHLSCEECECVPISKNGLDNLLKELVGENK